MKNNTTLAILVFIGVNTLLLPLFNKLASGEFYWGIAPSFFLALAFYFKVEKSSQEYIETKTVLKNNQAIFENILKESSLENKEILNSFINNNNLFLGNLQARQEKLSIDFSTNIKDSIDKGLKETSGYVKDLQNTLNSSINELTTKTLDGFSKSNLELTNLLKDSFQKQSSELSSIQGNLVSSASIFKDTAISNQESINNLQLVFTSNIELIKNAIIKSNDSYKESLENMSNMVANIDDHQKTMKVDFAGNIAMWGNIIKTSHRGFDESVNNLKRIIEVSSEGQQKYNKKLLNHLEENMERQDKQFDDFKEIHNKYLKNLVTLHKTDEDLINKILKK
ncbi:hypothetical protein HNQ02_000658 [Flavobacterium sp. 7E]|uniref:hypothetical protein n=1 Tax=Flavobacterium sp. 7E TaxID=2735898 RepID=UPI00156EAD37|nr:hypothetical protein [Flavobacterium sp. 7E]NRS87751.1 hypothetical protein [Flavobacterium sp. 7E]